MTDKCRWVASDQPRVLPGRHRDDCADETCRGCQPCTEPHCRICGTQHSLGACAGCVGEVRDNLTEIGRLCDDLPAEVEVRGVTGEAFNLLGPVADPEALGHMAASVAVGRVPAEYLEMADSDQHPLFVAATWSAVYREAFDHDEPSTRVNLAEELGYLARNLAYMANYEHVPFEELARDLRRCVAHLESVLHDGEQVDRGVPCMTCRRPLTRVWASGTRKDGWECKRCREYSTEEQYRFAVKSDYIQRAEWLTDVDMQQRTKVRAATVRSWAREQPGGAAPLIRKTLHSERTVYCVADVERVRDIKGLAPCA